MGRSKIRLEGLNESISALNREVDDIEDRTLTGLLRGGLIIQRESQKRVPVEYGNLRASAYTRVARDDPNSVEVGYTAEYALSVHENMEQHLKGIPRPSGLGVYWGPAGQPKFLESAARDMSDEVLAVVAEDASVDRRGRR